MNTNNLHQIFQHYINDFERINDADHDETYKWQVCKVFPERMETALKLEGKEFADALYKAKASTFNIIDSYTQPFNGLVDFARHSDEDAQTVKKMFLDLYSEDGGDLKIQMEKISDFFDCSNELLEKITPGSFRYKQNSHSVSAYLFLYSPETHYMYKASHAGIFADCIEFYDSWGSGDNVDLFVYYRMYDELINEINNYPALLATDASRFDGRFKRGPEELHPDENKHILAFDLLYCCSAYDLFDGISFKRPKAQEKNLFNERKRKANKLFAEYENAEEILAEYNDAKKYFSDFIKAGDKVKHKKYGYVNVKSVDENRLVIDTDEGEKTLGLAIAIGNGIIQYEDPDFDLKVSKYGAVLNKDKASLEIRRDNAKQLLEEYKEYLDNDVR